MSSLHRDPRGKSPFWYCAFTDAHGVRRFKSTKQTKRKAAEAVCNGFQRAADLGRRGTLSQMQVLKVVGEIYESVNHEPLNSSDAATFLREWKDSKKATTATSTARRYGDVVEVFLRFLGEKAARNLAGLTPREIAAFRDSYLTEGKANKTANMAVKTLRIALNVARKHGLILSNPAEAVDMLPDNAARRDVFTRTQISGLLGVADVEWRGMILIGAHHGLRLMDAARLGQSFQRVPTEMKSLAQVHWRKGNHAPCLLAEDPVGSGRLRRSGIRPANRSLGYEPRRFGRPGRKRDAASQVRPDARELVRA